MENELEKLKLEERRLGAEKAIYGTDMQRAWKDEAHPVFHLAPPSHCMIDVWGALDYKGKHHIFMNTTLDPDTDSFSEQLFYCHAVSDDFLHWQFLPIPIAPLENEIRLNDGYADLDANGHPVIIYTAVHRGGGRNAQWAAMGDETMSHFTRIGNEPMMTMENHGGPVYNNFSDPYVFRCDGRTFLTISKCEYPDGSSEMPIYEACDGSLTKWAYKGTMFDCNGEVVNFFPMGDKWVLIFSPYHTIQYYVGTFSTGTLRFTPEQHGILSYGYHRQDHPADRGYYATCVFRDQLYICGWIGGQLNTNAWSGTMSFPRKLGLNGHLCVTQMPIDEICHIYEKTLLDFKGKLDGEKEFSLNSCALDMDLSYRQKQGNTLKCSFTSAGKSLLTVTIRETDFSVNDDTDPLNEYIQEEDRRLRILMDHSVGEIFIGDGSDSASVVFPYYGENVHLKIETEEATEVKKLTIHSVKSCKPGIAFTRSF